MTGRSGAGDFGRLVAGHLKGGLPAGRALIVSDTTEAVKRQIDAAAAAAAHIVYVTDTATFKAHRVEELYLAEQGARYTIVRKGLATEALLPAAEVALRCGELICPSRLRLPLAAAGDYAAAVAAVLTQDGHEGQTYQLAGELALKPPGIATVLSRIAGRTIALREVELTRWEQPMPGGLRDELRRVGATEAEAAVIHRVYLTIETASRSVGHWWTTPGNMLAGLLGRPPLTVEAALRAALAPVARPAC